MEILLTICTAAYNAEKTIEKMINSVLSCRNNSKIELIIVNDGSTDNTQAVVERYVASNLGIIRLFNKENGGSGSARNKAFVEARGKYIKLVDADDYVVSENLDSFIEIIKDIDADLIWNGHFIECQGKRRVHENYCRGILEPNRVYDIQNDKCNMPIKYQMHCTTYRTEIIQLNNIKLPEGVSYVDVDYLMSVVPYINRIVYFDCPFYVYKLGTAGQSMSPIVMVKKEKQIDELVNRVISCYVNSSNVLNVNQREMMKRICAQGCVSIYLVNIYKRCGRKTLKEIDVDIKERCKEVWKIIPIYSRIVRLSRIFDYYGYFFVIEYLKARKVISIKCHHFLHQ